MKILKIIGVFLLVVFVVLTAGYIYIMTQKPNVGAAPDMKIEPTAQMIERGKYLANGFAACMDCHSKRDFTKFGGPIIPGTEGSGGENFGEGAGTIYASNITPDKETGVGSWTDGELFRAITMGVDKNGEPLGPMMPYLYFREIDENDIKAIIAYIRTIPPIKNPVPKHELNFPVNVVFRLLPTTPDFKKKPDESDKVKLGEYYSGACFACHTPFDGNAPDKSKMLSGGQQFPMPDGSTVTSANLTFDKETGIGNWTKQQFIDKFKFYANPSNQNIPVNKGEFNSPMPWPMLSQLKEEDLGAIYDYLASVPVIKNKVTKYSPPGVNPTAGN